ncbi:hypothetical protein GWK47_040943 [Chionoecetes opilio]|uniref:Uncharacterized protein n=1 Tax=Chionoecetes opilio TaxID=41210 RepID=A0A8J4YCV5_CHIOP|nr:hypothetical protein GWK47_040943 [Chionoecetes opilio]
MGSRGSGSRDFPSTPRHPTPARQRNGACVLTTKKWGKTCCISPVVTISWSWWYMRCSFRFSWVFLIARASALQTLPNLMGEHRPRGLGHGNHGGGSGDVLEDVKDELFDGLFKSFKSVRPFRDDYRELVKLASFSSVVPLPVEFRFLAPWSNAPGQRMSKVLYSFKIWSSGPFPA